MCAGDPYILQSVRQPQIIARTLPVSFIVRSIQRARAIDLCGTNPALSARSLVIPLHAGTHSSRLRRCNERSLISSLIHGQSSRRSRSPPSPYKTHTSRSLTLSANWQRGVGLKMRCQRAAAAGLRERGRWLQLDNRNRLLNNISNHLSIL